MHVPVLMQETINLLAVRPGGTYIDCTLGGGGHTRRLLEASAPDGRVLALDRDAEAVERAAGLVKESSGRLVTVQKNFADLESVVAKVFGEKVDAVLFDFGISSYQLDSPERGFSFQDDGPLDMRMNREQGQTAGDLLDELDEKTFTQVLREYADEHDARRLSRAVLHDRSQGLVSTTRQLADLVERVKGGRKGRVHPATKTFMALRMLVNREPESMREGLEQAFSVCRTGGRIAAISFHSYEDRIVKRCFAAHVGRRESLQQGGDRWVGTQPEAQWVQRKPLQAEQEEMDENPRSRSALLRVVQLREARHAA